MTLKKRFKKLYEDSIQNVISHSKRTDDFLKEYSFKGLRLYVPHFRYRFPKEYSLDNIDKEIKESVDSERINLLFFGNLNESKGVDILLDAVNRLSTENADKLNVIIAGKDFDGSVDRVKPLPDRRVKIFKRHITDDELRFLYQNVDYLSLPYRKTSQSGILEMAFYFKRPIIATRIPYFEKTLNEFPTFGILSGQDSEEYSKTLVQLIANHSETGFFSDNDYSRYENRKEVKEFLETFSKWRCNHE